MDLAQFAVRDTIVLHSANDVHRRAFQLGVFQVEKRDNMLTVFFQESQTNSFVLDTGYQFGLILPSVKTFVVSDLELTNSYLPEPERILKYNTRWIVRPEIQSLKGKYKEDLTLHSKFLNLKQEK